MSDPWIERVRAAILPLDITDGADRPTQDGQRRAAVLMPLILRNSWNVILTQRPETMPRHPGQISFPGGRVETGETARQGALRETEEEIGVSASHIDLLGRLPSFDAVSAYRVTPFVGIVSANAVISPDAREVAEVFEVPLAFFMDPANHHPRTVEFKGRPRQIIDMPYDDRGTPRNIWGMTAMMIHEVYKRGFA